MSFLFRSSSLQPDRVLLITYAFPPKGGVGVQRPLSYAKYLPLLGCQVFVLTARNATTAVEDPALLAQVPPATVIRRVLTPELPFHIREQLRRKLFPAEGGVATLGSQHPSPRGSLRSFARRLVQRFVFPDAQVVWSPFAIAAGCRLLRTHRIGAILVSTPPFSLLLVGLALKKRFPRAKLISEFRDEWLDHYLSSDPTATGDKRRRAARLERAVALRSDYVIAVTPSQAAAIRRRHPDLPDGKFLSVPNGYDPEAFRDFRPRPHLEPGMVIALVGTAYAHSVCSPIPYLQALEQVPDDILAQIETRFVGRVVPELLPYLRSTRAPIRQLGFLPQHDAFRQMEEADCLLLIVNSLTAHAGKLFEYMATGKPILALSPPGGEVAAILAKTRTGWCADPADPSDIRDMILRAWRAFQGGSESFPQPDWQAIREYERPKLVAAMARSVGIARQP